jgi:hypothetical protein
MELAEVRERLAGLERVIKVRKRANENSLHVWYRASAWSKDPIVRFWVYKRRSHAGGESRWVVVYEMGCPPHRSEVREGFEALISNLEQWQS